MGLKKDVLLNLRVVVSSDFSPKYHYSCEELNLLHGSELHGLVFS